MTTPNYDDILNALERQARSLALAAERCEGYSAEFPAEDARLLREAMDIVRERRDQGEAERPPQEMDLG